MENDTERAKSQDSLCLREGHCIFVPLFELAELSADKEDRKPHCDPDPIGILNQDIHNIHPATYLNFLDYNDEYPDDEPDKR